jgi:hypothetical protein
MALQNAFATRGLDTAQQASSGKFGLMASIG